MATSEFYAFEEPEPLPERQNDEDHLYGSGWFAKRTDDGCMLSWDGGELASKRLEASISEEEFERLRRSPESFPEIQFAHDPYR